MKRLISQSMIAVSCLFLAVMIVSCEGKNASILPDFGGEIKLDRTRIGKGQKVTATYPIPVGGQNIDPRQMYWNCDDNRISTNPIEKNGVSTLNFIAKYAIGKHKIEFVHHFLNIEASEVQSKSKTGEFTIVACDVLTSFWNDSKNIVLETANEKFQASPSTDLLEASGPNEKGSIEKHQYYFADDKLNKVQRIVLDNAIPGKAVAFINIRTILLEGEGYKRLSFEIVDIATGGKTAVDMAKLNDKSYTTPISTGVETGSLELLSVLQSDKTTVTLSYKLFKGLQASLLIYTPR